MTKITIALFVCFTCCLAATSLKAQKPKPKAKPVVIKKEALQQTIKQVPKETPKEVIKETPKEVFDYGYGPMDNTTLTVGPQVWIAKNLAVTTFANGDKIEQVQSNEEWVKAGQEKRPAWCYYENDPANGKTYGVLYNWYAIMDPRGIAPKGWHIPSKYEWVPLLDFLGGRDVAGNKMKSTTLWQPIGGPDRNGTNETGFAVLPAGLRFPENGTFDALGQACHYWTSTNNDGERAAAITLGISPDVYVGIAGYSFGYSVRCVKD